MKIYKNAAEAAGDKAKSAAILFAIAVIEFHLLGQSAVSGFWGSDASLFLRYAHDPAFFHYTSTAAAQAIEGSPSFTKELSFLLADFGITPKANGEFLYLAISTISTLSVYAALFLILRTLKVSQFFCATMTVTLLHTEFLTGYSRLHTLNNVMTNGGFSMLANALFLLSIALHVYGKAIIAPVVAVMAAIIHPVTGLLAIGFIAASAVVHDWTGKRRVSCTAAIPLCAAVGMLAVYVARTSFGQSLIYTGADKDLYFAYIKFRSSNPMPLRDGLQAVMAHLFVFWTIIFIAGKLDEGLRRVKTIILSVSIFWLVGLGAQIFFGEVMQSVTLVRLVLHRSSPLIFLLAAALIGFLLYRNILGRRYITLVIVIASSLITIVSSDTIVNVPFRYREANVVFWIGLVTLLAEFEKEYKFPRIYAAVFGLFMAAILAILRWGLEAEIIDTLRLFAVAVGVIGLAVLVRYARAINAVLANRSGLSPGLPVVGAFALAFSVKVLAGAWHSGQPRNWPRPRDALVEMLEQNTRKFDVIYLGDYADINGIRKPFFDFLYSWYGFYSIKQTKVIVQKLKALGIDVTNDPIAARYCSGYGWLFRPRCERTFGRIDERLTAFDWRRDWQNLKDLEPDLSYALVRKSRLVEADEVVATANDLALVRGP